MKEIKIGIISPSNNVLKVFPNRRKTGIKNLKDIGIDTIFSKNAFRDNDYSKKSIDERIEEINEILNEDIDLVMASIGGYTSIQLLDKIDYQKIKEKHITVCGFSDITALLLAIYTKTKEEVLYGPVYTVNLCDYGGIDEYTKESLLDNITGKKIEYSPSKYIINEYIDWEELENNKKIKKQINKQNDWIVINKGKATGKLFGGNLKTILLTLGTEYLPIEEFNDKILFLETCDSNVLEFCSQLESLKLRGILDNIKGIIIGKFDSDEMNKKIEDFLSEYFKEYNIPIICNIDFGHVFPILTFPIGRDATLECNDQNIKLKVEEKNK